ncbi:MAG: formyltransferase family protein [Chloroflexi bacterium]|nr:formyltransferase family protein [Chloroflexota bacterium]
MLKLGWFSTGRGEGSRRLLELVLKQIASGDLSVTIEFVFQNRERGEAEGSDQFQDLVRSYGIPLATLSSQRFRKGRGAGSFSEVRLEFDREVIRLLEGYQPNLSVLAGYMLYTADELCKHFTMINSHPALPDGPIGTWQQVIWQLINQQANETGAMIHLATEEWDRGPVISYFSFPLRGPLFDPLWEQIKGRTINDLRATEGERLPLFQRIHEEGGKREPHLLVETIRAFAEGTVRIVDGQMVDAAGNPIPGYCLNENIEAALGDR